MHVAPEGTQTDARDAGPHIPSRDAHNSDHQDLSRCQNNGNRVSESTSSPEYTDHAGPPDIAHGTEGTDETEHLECAPQDPNGVLEESMSEQNDGCGLPSPASSMTGAECSNPLLRASRQRQSAAKMMVRSGLRCHKCFSKTWVCLCDRAPRELDRRGTRSAQSELYMSASSICLQGVDTPGSGVNSTPDAPRPGQKSPSSRRTARHLGWSTHKPAYLWLATVSKADSHITRSRLVQYFKRFNQPPTRGPKSAPAPYRHDAMQKSHRRRGVRVSPLSAGGEGLRNARSRFLYAPGKLAEGIQKQLGVAPCLYSHSNWQQSPGKISSVMPWGRRFRLWKFRYKVVRHKKKRHSKPHTVAEEERHQPSRSEADTERTTSCQAPGQLPSEGKHLSVMADRVELGYLLCFLVAFPSLGWRERQDCLAVTTPSACVQANRPGKGPNDKLEHGHTWYRGRLLWSYTGLRPVNSVSVGGPSLRDMTDRTE